MSDEPEDDVKAISTLMSVLKPLDQETRIHVLEFVLKRLGVSLTNGPTALPVHAPAPTRSVPDVNPRSMNPATSAVSVATDIRSFAAEKQPKTVNEKVAVIGYYLAHIAPQQDRRDYIVADDIRTYFIQARFPLPAAPPNMSLIHAKNAGYLVAMERGQYKLNAVGHNLVAHKLPVREGETSKRSPTRKPAAKKGRRKVEK